MLKQQKSSSSSSSGPDDDDESSALITTMKCSSSSSTSYQYRMCSLHHHHDHHNNNNYHCRYSCPRPLIIAPSSSFTTNLPILSNHSLSSSTNDGNKFNNSQSAYQSLSLSSKFRPSPSIAIETTKTLSNRIDSKSNSNSN